MTTDAKDRPEMPKPPSLGHVTAVLLELLIFADVARHRSLLGVLCCVAYFYFSATRAAFVGTKE